MTRSTPDDAVVDAGLTASRSLVAVAASSPWRPRSETEAAGGRRLAVHEGARRTAQGTSGPAAVGADPA